MSDDINDTVQSERFNEILTLKKQVLDTKDEIDRNRAAGRLSEAAGIELYQRKVRDYIISVETVLNPNDGDTSPFWDERRVGQFSLPDGEVKVINGLADFLELPTTFTVEIETERQRSYRHKRETVTDSKRVRPPERLIEQAFRMTNRALDAAGFDLDEPTEHEKSEFKNIDDVEKATKIYDFLKALDDDGLRELQNIITNELLNGSEMTNGHHE